MPNTYTSAILFPPGKGLFFGNKESFLKEYLDYSKFKDEERKKEVEARVNFYQRKYSVHYKVFDDSASFIFEADSLEDAHNTFTFFIKDISNVFQIQVLCTPLEHINKELTDFFDEKDLL
jgi:hypothetical protein|tara:strand:+ start:44 stop:403 length:360 start_codon:yes stop_codon:yes gene_type:complete